MMNKEEYTSDDGSQILSDEVIYQLLERLPNIFGPQMMGLISEKLNMENFLRFQSVASNCKKTRESKSLSLKAVSKKLKIPQYRIGYIEQNRITQIDPKVLKDYLELLGLNDWYEKWAQLNTELSEELSL